MPSKSPLPPIHIHINNTPVSDADINCTTGPSTQGLKHSHSTISNAESTDSDSDEEALPLSEVLGQLHRKFPQLNLPQYMPLLEKEGIFYAETVAEFDKEFYISLGMSEGAASPFMAGVKKILRCEKKEKKWARIYNTENSVEI